MPQIRSQSPVAWVGAQSGLRPAGFSRSSVGVTATPTAGKALGQDHPLAVPFTLSDFQVHGPGPGALSGYYGLDCVPFRFTG